VGVGVVVGFGVGVGVFVGEGIGVFVGVGTAVGVGLGIGENIKPFARICWGKNVMEEAIRGGIIMLTKKITNSLPLFFWFKVIIHTF
jgi:hypothetical protein